MAVKTEKEKEGEIRKYRVLVALVGHECVLPVSLSIESTERQLPSLYKAVWPTARRPTSPRHARPA